jgi:glycosyltransferase involved in cell wall biosynthesis
MRLVWIAPKYPLGTPDGARLATCALIRHLTTAGVGVDLICLLSSRETADADAAMKNLGVSSCTLITRPDSALLSLKVNQPYTLREFAAKKVQTVLKEKLCDLIKHSSDSAGTFIVFDGLHAFASLLPKDREDIAAICGGLIYRAHNFETALWTQCAQKARVPLMRWLYQYQAELMRKFERNVSQKAALIAPVSEEDAGRFRGLAPDANISSIPIGMEFPPEGRIDPVNVNAGKMRALFVGRLDWIPNRNGLKWFLEKVWPAAVKKRPELSLTIAGVGNGQWLEKFRLFPGVRIMGRVEDLSPLYRACTLAIAPLFQGSGTRVKILESARYARAVVSTALGAEGTGLVAGVSFLRAENQREWTDVLQGITLERCREIGRQAFFEARDRFDARSIADQFLKELKKISGTQQQPIEALAALPCPLGERVG